MELAAVRWGLVITILVVILLIAMIVFFFSRSRRP